MKNRGFTLVEILVVIVILGIITAMSIPLIRNVQNSMEEKKYVTYLDSLKSSSKLYMDSYSEDVFGRVDTGVYCVSYEELENKNLIKDISIEDISCDRERTFVRVTKIDDKYVYSPYLACGSKKDNTNITKVLPKGSTDSMTDDFCSKDISTTINVDVDKTYIGNSFNKKRKKTRIIISSLTGINNNVVIYAKWSKDKKDQNDSGFEKISFKIEGNQKEKILNGEVIETKSDELITPKGGDGKYYLIIRVDSLTDLYGNSWKSESNYKSFGPFAVDNVVPEIKNLTVDSTTPGYNNLKADVNFAGSDNHTSKEELQMCISYSGYCTTYKKYKESSTIKFTGEYDGSKKTVYVTLKDQAGNITKQTKKYQVGITHTLTYDTTIGIGCGDKRITHNVGDNTTWGSLCTPTKAGYTFLGWYTKKNGKGDKITSTSKVTKDLTVYANWRTNKVYIKLDMNGGSLSSSHGSNISTSGSNITVNGSTHIHIIEYDKSLDSNGLADWNNPNYINIEKTGYSIKSGEEWIKGSKKYNQTSAYKASDFCDATEKDCSVTLKANWQINYYTLTINDNGGSGCGGTITKKYKESWDLTCEPTRRCYKFAGWSTNPTTATSNGTATANWATSDGWVLTNSIEPLTSQKWIWCSGGSPIQSGWHDLPISGEGSDIGKFYFVGGYAWCNGWWRSAVDQPWYYLSNHDLNENKLLDCRMYHDETRLINGTWYHFDSNGVCDSPGC